jgi:hypothetical protein
MQFINVAHTEGRFDPEDATFITEARVGWPYAIQRALEAEREIDQLRNELSILQEHLQQRCHHRS